jgi:signal transduction histidine kinase
MLRFAQTVVWVFYVAFAAPMLSAAVTNEILTSAAGVLSLTAAQAARNIPVLVTGVVTIAEADWGGRFFVQDSSSGVFVNCTMEPPPSPGDLVQVRGVSDPGNYSAVINSAIWKKVGTAPLPEAKPLSVERFMSGAEDGQRVQVSGVVTSVQAGEIRITLELESGRYRFHAFAPASLKGDLNSLVGANVHIRGTAAVSLEAQQRGNPHVNLFLPQNSDFIVDQPQATTLMSQALATAAEVSALTRAQAARSIRVSVTGVVTVAEPNWGGDFFVQDSTGGVFVNNTNQPQPALGDLVEISGVSHSGRYVPDIIGSHWKKLGTAPLPNAKPVSVERLMSGAEHGRRVELLAVVRSARPSQIVQSRQTVELASGGYHFRAFIPLSSVTGPNSLIGATVRVRGTAAASFSQALRHILTLELFGPLESDFNVEELPAAAISEEPITPLNDFAQYHQNGSPEARIRVKGVVLYQRPGEDVFLHDETAALQVKCSDTNVLSPGEVVEAIGFAGSERSLPVLEDAALVQTKESQKPIAPQKVSVRELLEGLHHADLVSLQGKLLDCSLRRLRTARSLSNAPTENILTLQNGAYFFSAQAPAVSQFDELTSIPIGSTLEVSGICVLQAAEQGKMESAQVLLRDAASVRILRRPGWWTTERLLATLSIVLGVSLVGMAFVIVILRKNSALKDSISEKIKAQGELQKAHDLLETRVQERTKQLKVEMNAREKAEVRVKAITAERTRIAQELHDTLLQGFTSVGLKLDTLTNNLPSSLEATKQQYRKILAQSDEYLLEARHAVLELRSPSLETLGDFTDALKKVSERALNGTKIRLQFATDGAIRKFEPAIENNLLRICEEAVTNAVKHATPTQVEVHLEYAPSALRLRIRDDGSGFNPNGPDASKNGHFGLVGIRERANDMAGDISLKSQPGQGTEIAVNVPLPA